jgi:competence protein ComFC
MTHRSNWSPPGWRYSARQTLWAVIDFVFPPRCGGCGRERQRFCATCRSAISYLSVPLCAQCGYPLPSTDSPTCSVCLSTPPRALAGIRSVAFFEGPLREALHALKYRRDIILADTLAELLHEAWRVFDLPGDVVMPVPLSSQRYRERGYNQAELLARGFSDLAGLAFAPQGAQRLRHTPSQVGLSAVHRRHNMDGAFKGDPGQVAGRKVLLIDDICTTGSTLAACGEALVAAGAAMVWGLTVGRARRAIGIE